MKSDEEIKDERRLSTNDPEKVSAFKSLHKEFAQNEGKGEGINHNLRSKESNESIIYDDLKRDKSNKSEDDR